MVLEVADDWVDILLTRSVFRCGFERRPHKCSCPDRRLFIWGGAAGGAPSAHELELDQHQKICAQASLQRV